VFGHRFDPYGNENISHQYYYYLFFFEKSKHTIYISPPFFMFDDRLKTKGNRSYVKCVFFSCYLGVSSHHAQGNRFAETSSRFGSHLCNYCT
jgi:hypothetical protein